VTWCPHARAALVLMVLLAPATPVLHAQTPPPKATPTVEKLGSNLYRIGEIRIDTAKREITVPGRINETFVLEFVANTRDGRKAYESAITIDTDAVAFNAALLLIGLDKSRSRAPVQHFDPTPPKGDEVAVHVEWTRGTEPARVAIEALLFDREKGPIPPCKWVYTGSTFLPDGQYLAEMDGTLIGFVHSPSPIIEEVGGAGMGRFGHIILNPNLGLAPNTGVTLTVKAVG
jgi:hypothetical protein